MFAAHRQRIGGAAVLAVLVVVAFAFGYFQSAPAVAPAQPGAPLTSASPPPVSASSSAPVLSEREQNILKSSKGFQALVSITDRGFEPADIAVDKGGTIRFTNNSGESVRIAASGSPLYPAGGEGCGESAFDSCIELAPHGFWEMTFNASGIWAYGGGGMKGTVRVR